MPPATEATEPVPTLAQELDLRLAETRGALSGNDERLARFVRDHLDDLAFQTTESLAQGAGVSAAAVVRFARRLGFASFRELRDRARSELRTVTGAPVPREALHSVLARKAQADIANLELLPRMLGEHIEAAAALIAGARTTWFLANRETHGLAVYAHRLLHLTRSNVGLVDPGFPDPLRDLGPQDALIACTFRPYARTTLELAATVRAAGVPIVWVTDGLAHDFIQPGDIVLAVPVESPTLFLSFTAALCVLEALAALIAAHDPDVTYANLEATATFVNEHRIVVDRAAAPAATKPTAARSRRRAPLSR